MGGDETINCVRIWLSGSGQHLFIVGAGHQLFQYRTFALILL